ncbi:MAG TPA: hypothetical protein VFX97_16945 [Pyrinomonadaceae bacterium]|nr:hypothetical protein [Pyrinomonadaceae bacterium]
MGTLTNSRATTPVSEIDAQKVATYNGSLQILDSLEAGKIDIAITTADVTLTGTPAAPQAQNKYFNISGTLTGNRSLIFPVNDDDPATGNPRTIYVKNGTAGAFTLTVKVSGQTGVTVTQGTTAILLHNGTDFVKILEVNHATGVISTASLGAAWASYVPTWTNITVGNGTVTAKFQQIGKTVFVVVHLVFGSTTAVSGAGIFSLPVTSVALVGAANATPLGVSQFYDTSAGQNSAGNVVLTSTTTALLGVAKTDGTYLQTVGTSSTVPFTWTTGDEIHAEFFYEAA